MSAVPMRAGKPRVCFVGLDNLPVLAREYNHHYIGGEPVQQTLLAKALARRGYEVSMVVADYGQADGASWDGVQTFKAYAKSAGLPVARFVHPRWTGLWSAMKRANADVYYTSCAGAQVGQMALFCRTYGRGLIFRSASDTDCDPDRLLIRYWRDKKLYAHGLRHAHAVLTQSKLQEQTMRSKFGRDSTVAGMLVDFGRHLPYSQRDIDMLWVSNLRTLKRPDLFLDLSSELPEHAAQMVGGPFPGEAQLYDSIENRARALPHLNFAGRVAYHDAGSFYERARVLVNTSEIEGFPNTFLQAWSCGTPVVSFFDPDGVIAREGLGRAVTDLAQMRSAVAELSRNEIAWTAASARCIAFMEREFGEDRILNPYITAIHGVSGWLLP
jgi:glycosyltransferase involved in cell wall biosynthesis